MTSTTGRERPHPGGEASAGVERALAGGPSAIARRRASRASCRCASASRCCSTRARSPRRRCSPTGRRTGSAPTASSPASATLDGRPVALMANDPTVKAGSWGPEDGREDPPHPGARAEPADADGLPRRLGRRAHHRAGADVPGPPRRRAIFHNQVQAVGRRAAGLRAVRPERRRRRLHPGVLRRRDHARRQRVDVPRLAAHGRDGDRREGHARGDGRRADAHRRLRLRPPARQDRRGGHRRSRGATSPTSRRNWEQQPPAAPPAAAPASRDAARGARSPADENKPFDMQGADRRRSSTRARCSRSTRAGRRSSIVGYARLDGRVDRHRRQPAQAQGRRAVRRLRRQGRALHLDLQRVQRAAAVPRRRARAS